MNKWVWIAAGTAVLAAGGYYGYTAYSQDQPVSTIQQRTAQAARGELSVLVSGSGSVSTVNNEQVKAGEAGTLEQVLFKAGDRVAKGQLLAVFEAPDVENQITQTQNAIKKQEMQYEQLKEQYISAQDDNGRKEMANAIESLKLDMESNRLNLSKLQEQQEDVVRIVAPIDGKVAASDIAVGQQVQPDTVIAAIVDYENLQSVIQVDELDIPKVKVGQEASVTLDALEDTAIQGKVTRIADEGTATNGVSVFDVTVEFKAVEGVKSGMTAQAEILIERKENALLLPIEAVRDMGGNKAVILAQESGERTQAQQSQGSRQGQAGQTGGNGQAQQAEGRADGQIRQAPDRNPAGGQDRAGAFGNLRQVAVGIYNESYIEIVSGLEEGDVVVLPNVVAAAGSSNIRAGMGSGFPGAGGFPGGGTGGTRQLDGGQGGGGAH